MIGYKLHFRIKFFIGDVPHESEQKIQKTGQPHNVRRDLCCYVVRGTSPAFSHALAESTPGESEPSVTAEPSAEPTSARLSFQTTGSLTPIPY